MLRPIINTIENQQSIGCEKYPQGLFPSQRVHPMTNYSREDNNIFFSALIAFTMQQLRHALPDDLRLKVDNITKRVISNYSRYRHPADRATYNFWQDLPNAHFPNGRLLKYLPFLALPADSGRYQYHLSDFTRFQSISGYQTKT